MASESTDTESSKLTKPEQETVTGLESSDDKSVIVKIREVSLFRNPTEILFYCKKL